MYWDFKSTHLLTGDCLKKAQTFFYRCCQTAGVYRRTYENDVPFSHFTGIDIFRLFQIRFICLRCFFKDGLSDLFCVSTLDKISN